jgi:hypothetical protein
MPLNQQDERENLNPVSIRSPGNTRTITIFETLATNHYRFKLVVSDSTGNRHGLGAVLTRDSLIHGEVDLDHSAGFEKVR